MTVSGSIGIIGGSGMLGSAIARALLDRKILQPSHLWISNRSGNRAGFEAWPEVRITNDNAQLCEACDVIILSVPPAMAPDISIDGAGRLVISVMAAVTVDDLRKLTGSDRIVRAMSSPAAALGLAYSPWVATSQVNAADRAGVTEIFRACGVTDEIDNEAHLDHFTAMTGPVPGFVAYYAQCMIDHAVNAGIAPDVADRAMRQLFLSAGAMMANSKASPAEHVQDMIDYAGTTAAGLVSMKNSPIARAISEALDASADKARSMR